MGTPNREPQKNSLNTRPWLGMFSLFCYYSLGVPIFGVPILVPVVQALAARSELAIPTNWAKKPSRTVL